MKSKEYWQKRTEAVANIQHRKTDEYVRTQLKREYDRARKSIQDQIDSFYVRFAINNEISLSEARKLLSSSELEDFKMTLDEFTRLAKNNPDGRWTQKLNNASYKVRVSRLEALMLQIEGTIQRLNMTQNEQMTSLLSSGYTETYYRTMYEIQKGIGIGATFAKIDNKTVERIIKTPWLEQNYSERIWGDNRRLVRQLETEITQAIIRGEDVRRTAKVISDRMDVGYRNAARLVRTEMSHIQNQATFHSYRESGIIKKYEFLATLDERTCSICGPLDGQVFTLSEKQEGVNIAPLHPNCRCDTVPYFENESNIGERIARNEEGQSYYVPGDISYNEWKEQYVEQPKPPKNVIIKIGEPRRFKDGNDVKEWEKLTTPSWLEKLTDHEKTLIRDYTGSLYIRINGELRRGDVSEQTLKYAEAISSAINKFELREDIVVYRGMDNIFGATVDDFNNNFRYRDKGFVSTSLLREGSFHDEDLFLEIRVPAGTKAALINPISLHKDIEYELLIDKNTQFRVIEAKESRSQIHLVVEVIKGDE